MSLIALLRENTRKAKDEQIDENDVKLVENFLINVLKQESKQTIHSYCDCWLNNIPTKNTRNKLVIIKDFCNKHGLGYIYQNDSPNAMNSSSIRISW